MATDSSLEVRRAVLTRLKTDAAMIAIVPAADIHRQVTPATVNWPFVKYGSPSSIPVRAACVDGSEITFSVHGFSKGRKNASGQETKTAEDDAAQIGAQIARSLDGQRLAIAGGAARIRWTGSQLLVDGAEADAFHTVQNFVARCLT